MSEIAKLYDQVMAGAETEKTAAAANDVAEDGGPQFDRDFFEKVASGDEEAVSVINQFIEESRAEGHSDEEIEAAIAEAMADAGIEDESDLSEPVEVTDEFEHQKAAAYRAGSEKAVEDILNSELAKEAGVTLEDLIDYELGSYFGAGYAETRQELEQVVEKIASKKKGAKNAARALLDKITGGARSAHGRLAEALAPRTTPMAGQKMTNEMRKLREQGLAIGRRRANIALGTAGVAGLGGAGYGVYRVTRKKDY